jgi:hypothetical protein
MKTKIEYYIYCKFSILFFLSILHFSISSSVVAGESPQLQFIDNIYPFVELDVNKNFEAEILRFKNIGTSDLKILDIISVCDPGDCMTLFISGRTFPPNEIGQITIPYGDRQPGEVNRTIDCHQILITNDPDCEKFEFQIRGIIKRGIEATPRYLNFGTISKDIDHIRFVDLSGDNIEGLKIQEILIERFSEFIFIDFIVPAKSSENPKLKVTIKKAGESNKNIWTKVKIIPIDSKISYAQFEIFAHLE